jgi:hypothetical protein
MLLPDPEEQFTSPGNFAPLIPFLNLPSTFFWLLCSLCVLSSFSFSLSGRAGLRFFCEHGMEKRELNELKKQRCWKIAAGQWWTHVRWHQYGTDETAAMDVVAMARRSARTHTDKLSTFSL